MTKKEKEAIERIEKRIKDNEDYSTNQVWLTEDVRCARVLLNCIEKKEKELKALKYIENKLMPLAECSYWNYKKHTCTHTCKGCDYLNENNRRTETGILIDKDRYCRLYEDGDYEEDTKFVSVQDLISRHWKGEKQ